MRSRLKSNVKKRTIHILLIITGILIVLALFGSQILIVFSTALGTLKGDKDQVSETTNVSYIAPPVLDPLPAATNKKDTSVSGSTSADKASIELYVNGKNVDKLDADKNGNFTFQSIQLNTGDNEINAKSTVSNKTSEYSNSLKIKYIGKEPSLEISSPLNDQKFKKDESPIKIIGKTDQGVKVTINDFWAMSNEDGSFYYPYNLKDGDNNLVILATDDAGNKTKKELKIKVE